MVSWSQAAGRDKIKRVGICSSSSSKELRQRFVAKHKKSHVAEEQVWVSYREGWGLLAYGSLSVLPFKYCSP